MALGTTITWYGHSCVEVATPGGGTVLFDPWFGNPRSPRTADAVERCDVMLVTHGHHDHIGSAPGQVRDADALAIARRTKPAWPCIHELSLWLEDRLAGAGVEVIGMNKGGTVETRGLRITMTTADHSAGDWSVAGEGPLYLGEAAGFVVELEDGRRLYHAGDTALFGDLRLIGELYRPDLAMLPIGGHYTMGPSEAAAAVELLGVTEVLPLHYGTFPILTGTPEALRAALSDRGLGGITVHAPEPGGSVVLDPY
ncbi:MAG TPA: metal-dependent hydrolase [Candidatus Eisenbacteria bacterium]|nr:metal-dependent hydrolase [Candidatus Eisenbacteria bacterium]